MRITFIVALSAACLCGCLSNTGPGIVVFCSDDNPCTAPLVCIDGVCVEDPGGEPCLAGEPCDDGDACTTDDTCAANGVCAGVPLDCDDGDSNTVDACVGGGCSHIPVDCSEGVSCDDGDPCTLNDACTADGACVGATLDCDDGDPTTEDTCEQGQCVHTPPTEDCTADNDGEVRVCQRTNDWGTCHGAETCVAGAGWSACTAALAQAEECDGLDNDCDLLVDEDADLCDDGDPATADACVDGTCVSQPPPCVPGAPCSDGDACTLEDTCTLGAAPPCTEPGAFGCPCAVDAECLSGVCVEAEPLHLCSKLCEAECEDGWACETVTAGSDIFFACLPETAPTCGGVPLDCDDDDATTLDWCEAGECLHEPPSVCDEVSAGLLQPCSASNEHGTCQGFATCVPEDGWVDCDAATPEAESCDFLDNDCDGGTDEEFKDEDGLYTLDEHCGTCGNDCTALDGPYALTCQLASDGPKCAVLCPPPCTPTLLLDDCLCPPTPTLCEPCSSASDCAVPPDQCIALEGEGTYCGRDCSADNPYGTPAGECPPEFTCIDVGGGNQTCMPANGSCECSSANEGELKTCSIANDFGTCYGVETCDANLGWLDCTAAVPAPEMCNGLDDDCDGQIDDDASCDDDDPCTLDICSGGVCEHQATETGGQCDDGDPCTLGDTCTLDGSCVGSPMDCDDGDPDTVDACDDGQCVNVAGCPVAVIAVTEGSQVVPGQTLHLVGSGSSVPGGGTIATYEWSVTQPDYSQKSFLPSAGAADPTFAALAAGSYVFQLTVYDQLGVASCEAATYTVEVVPDDDIYLEVLWNTPNDPDQTDEGPEAGSDLDIHYLHAFATGLDVDGDGTPDGWFDNPFDCFWFNYNPNWGSLDPMVDDDPVLLFDDTDGAGPEAIGHSLPEDGLSYRFGVHYWNDHGWGSSEVKVSVWIQGEMVYSEQDVVLVNHDMWEVANIAWPSGQVTPITDAGGGHKIIPNYEHPLFLGQ